MPHPSANGFLNLNANRRAFYIVTVIVALVLMAMVAMYGYSLNNNVKSENHRYDAQVASNLLNLKDQLRNLIIYTEVITQLQARAIKQVGDSSGRWGEQNFDFFLLNVPEIFGFALVDSDNVLMRAGFNPDDISDQFITSVGKQKGVFPARMVVHQQILTSNSKTKLLPLTQRIKFDTHKLYAVVFLNSEKIKTLIRDTLPPGMEFSALVDNIGNVLVSGKSQLAMGDDQTRQELKTTLEASNLNFQTVIASKDKVIGDRLTLTASTMSPFPINIVAGYAPPARISQQIGKLAFIAAGFGAGFILFVIFLYRTSVKLDAQQGRLESLVTERTKEMDHKSSLLEAVLSSINQGLVAYDSNLKLIISNERFSKIRDVPDEMSQPGASFEDWVRLDATRGEFEDGDPEQIIHEKVLQAQNFSNHHFERTRPDGTVIEVAGGPLPGGGFVSTFSDITERKQQEIALRKNEQQFRRILEDSPLAVMISLDDKSPEDGIIQFANPRSLLMFEIDESDIGKVRTRDFFQEGEERQFEQKSLDDGNSIIDIDRVVISTNGNKVSTLMSISPIEYQDRKAALIWLYDVTERKQAEEELRKLSHAVEQSPASVVITDPKGNIEYVNPKFTEITGYTAEESIGQNPSILKSGHTPPKEYEDLWKTISAGNDWRGEFLNTRKDGSEYWEFASISPITNDADDITHFLAVKEDITERKEGEIELMNAKEKAELATQAKSAFLAAMSHEIRTPMNGVVGMIDLLRETKLDADQHQMMRTVRDSAFSLLQIINDILDFSKIEAGKMAIENVPISVRDVVEGVAETLLPNTSSKDIQLLIYIDPKIPSWVMSDQVRLRQILFNIAGNAVKFTETTADKKGIVIIRAERMPASDDKHINISFSISDNGIGMSPTAVSNLFKPFTQAESSTTRRFGGTGLGLSICKNLTEIMGGVIRLESVEGEGSTFMADMSFDIPEYRADSDDLHDLSSLHVLVVMNNKQNTDIVTGYLSYYGATTEHTDTIDKAEGLIVSAQEQGKPFDLVVVDSFLSDVQQPTFVESVREKVSGLRFVLLNGDRTARKGLIKPDLVVVETDPLKRSSFMRAAAMAAGRASPDVATISGTQDKTKTKAPSVDEARAAGQLILIAEDNMTNQDVIKRQLGMLGYACEMADDGVQAFQAWQNGSYAILLTDCHMPEMDGYELTGEIRKAEYNSDVENARIPIIAITANALQGEGDRCLVAGMDDYLSKPLEMEKLKKALARWMPISSLATTETPLDPLSVIEQPAPTIENAIAPIDPSALKSVFGDDEETYKEILADFVKPSQSNVDEIEAAFAARSADGVAKAAHKLKSSSRSVGANQLADLCQELEAAGKGDDWAVIERGVPTLPGIMASVTDYINSL